VFADPHVSETKTVEEIEHPRIGKLRVLATPIRMATRAGRSGPSHPPALRQDSREVLRDFGLPASRIDALISGGVVQCA
jgi:crotonobetainyl-CoA:carnitine CoA-transferase CaiB-like acyl-CoA transferase